MTQLWRRLFCCPFGKHVPERHGSSNCLHCGKYLGYVPRSWKTGGR